MSISYIFIVVVYGWKNGVNILLQNTFIGLLKNCNLVEMIPPCLIITDFDNDSDRGEMTMMTAVIVIIIIKEMFHTSHCYQTRALTHARMQTHKCVCVYSPLHFHLQLVNHQRNARKP